jgi:prepilin-type N-terminal cleavage/methylation domain-containing protein
MNSTTPEPIGAERQSEAGFSLIEVLIAIVVLVFGIISVANLMIVAAANNMTANSGSAAVTAAIQEMELLKSQPFAALVPGRTVKVIGDESTRGDEERGVGIVHVISKVDPVPGAPNTVFLTVIATPISAVNIRGGVAAINPAAPPVTRSQAIFTSFRTQEGQ